VAEVLAERGDRVVVLDDLSSGSESNLRDLGDGVELRQVDIASDPLDVHFRGVDAVFHLAAVASVPRTIDDPLGTHRTNVDGTLRVLDAARLAGVRRWEGASSSAIYGDDPALPKREEMRPDPVSPYGAHKAMLEIYARAYWSAYGLETVALRYFNVFGPRQDPKSSYAGVLARFIPELVAGRVPVIYGDGKQSRDFVPVRDVARATVRAAEANDIFGEVFNVASGRARSVTALLGAIQEVMGTSVTPRHEAARRGDIRHSVADISRAASRLGWTPSVSFGEGLRSTVDWYRRLREAPSGLSRP
jgi:UDP-glucose 4-epimerase